MLISRDNQICLEFAFWKSRPPVALGGIYEMRTYLLKVPIQPFSNYICFFIFLEARTTISR